MAALTRQRAKEDGVPNGLHVKYYSQRASAGLVVTEGVFPSFTSRTFPGQAGIANEQQQTGWATVANAVHARGGTIFMQIMSGGRVGHPEILRGAQPYAPSAISPNQEIHTFTGKRPAPVPRAMTEADLDGVVEEYVRASRRAIDAGLDGVEIHCANGYLLHQFFATSSNQRVDDWGGSPAKRAAFPIRLIRAVAEEIGAARVGVRISPEHNFQQVLENDRADVLATYSALLDGIQDLELAYISLLHKDAAGGAPGHDLPAWFRQQVRGTLIANTGFGVVTDLEQARIIVESGRADAVAVGRQLIANPDLVERWRADLVLNAPDPSTFYFGGAQGYIDYPFYAN